MFDEEHFSEGATTDHHQEVEVLKAHRFRVAFVFLSHQLGAPQLLIFFNSESPLGPFSPLNVQGLEVAGQVVDCCKILPVVECKHFVTAWLLLLMPQPNDDGRTTLKLKCVGVLFLLIFLFLCVFLLVLSSLNFVVKESEFVIRGSVKGVLVFLCRGYEFLQGLVWNSVYFQGCLGAQRGIPQPQQVEKVICFFEAEAEVVTLSEVEEDFVASQTFDEVFHFGDRNFFADFTGAEEVEIVSTQNQNPILSDIPV